MEEPNHGAPGTVERKRDIFDARIEVSPLLVYQKEKELFQADPIGLVKSEFLKIKTKDGELAPLKLKAAQRRVIDMVQKIRKEQRSVKMVILKSRQLGFSTMIEAILFAFSTQRPYFNSLILSHSADHANYLLKMCQLYYDCLQQEQPHLCPQKKHSTEFKFEFAKKRSMIEIDTAKNLQSGRGGTYRMVHGSEVAFWPNFEDLMKALMPSVPDRPDSMVFLETTANGTNQFFKLWNRINKDFKKGKTDWIPIFIPWSDDEDCVRPFGSPSARDRFSHSLTRDEKEMQAAYSLTIEQLHWRRMKIENDFFGDEKKFKVEYPICAEEAFQSTSKQVFPQGLLKVQESHAIEPKIIGEIDWDGKKTFIIPNERGDLRVYEPPKVEHRYVIGADCGQSATSHDASVIQVIDRTTWRQVAVYHSHTDPDLFAKTLFALGAWYHWAPVAPELNGPGVAVVSYLRDLQYPTIHRREKMQITDDGSFVQTEELGWQTNVKTKPIIVQGMVEALRNVLVVLHDAETLSELSTYVVKEVKEEGYIKYGAEEGAYDDRVMALMIAVHLAKQLPDRVADEIRPPGFHITHITGYG